MGGGGFTNQALLWCAAAEPPGDPTKQRERCQSFVRVVGGPPRNFARVAIDGKCHYVEVV